MILRRRAQNRSKFVSEYYSLIHPYWDVIEMLQMPIQYMEPGTKMKPLYY